jgi:DNA-binding transcriptional regulator YiaG
MRLQDYIDGEGLTAEKFGNEIDHSVHTVNKWLRGERVPRPKQMQKIFEATKGRVTANDFMATELAE